MNLEENFRSLRHQTYTVMLERDACKYYWFISAVSAVKCIPFWETRGKFLEAYYVYHRNIDDIADRDAPCPSDSVVGFIEDRLAFALDPSQPEHPLDHLLLFCYNLGERFGQDFRKETHNIVSYMLFDAKRFGTSKVYPASVLNEQLYMRDITGTIQASLKVFKEDPAKTSLLETLGHASRIYYTLRDFTDDVAKGYVNITTEEMELFSISPTDIRDLSGESIMYWREGNAALGHQFLIEHRKQMRHTPLRFFTRAVLRMLYESPAQRYFSKIVEVNKRKYGPEEI